MNQPPSHTPLPQHEDLKDLPALVERMRGGERRATSRVLTELERASDVVPQLIDLLQPFLGRALVLGITGPPGAGKSTLVNGYMAYARAQGVSVGVIAVDPSSPISGGAILGDRVRMSAALDDDGVFIRSLASRGHPGGLSPAAVRLIDGLDGAGKDLIILETVGTGQSELDVADIADIKIVVSAPGLGDGIQAMKSGLLEIADIMVVNKADREGAEQTMQQLAAALSMRLTQRRAGVPVLKTTATTGDGIAALFAAVAALSDEALSQPLSERRRKRARYLIARAAADLIAARIRGGGTKGGTRDKERGALDSLCDSVLSGTVSPSDVAKILLKE